MQTSQIVAFLETTGALDLEARAPWPGRPRTDETDATLRTEALLGPPAGGGTWVLPVEARDAVLVALGSDAPMQAASATARWDVDAWYQPVHLHAYDGGIHVREQSVLDLAVRLASAASPGSLPATHETAQHLVRMAFVTLYLHQHFHHRVEMLGLHLLVVGQKPRYVAYYRDAYARTAGTDDQLEEALANAYVHRMLTRRAHSSGVPADVRRLVAQQVRDGWAHDDPGYRRAAGHLTPEAWARGLGELHGRVDEASATPSRRAIWRHLGPDLTGSFLDPARDVFAVAPVGAEPLLPRRTPGAPSCTSAQMVALLERHGYEQVRRQRGPALRLTCKGRAVAVVPASGTLSSGATARLLALVDADPADLPS